MPGEEGAEEYRVGAILTISFFAHLLVHTYMVLFPVLMPFIIEEFGVDYFVVGIMYTISNLAFGFGAIGAGFLTDRIGSRALIVACALGMGISSLLSGMTPDLVLLTAYLFLLGLFASLYHPASFSLISKATPSRGKAFGIHGVGGTLGLALGPILGVPIAMEWGWRAAFLVLAIPGIVLGLTTLMVKLGTFISNRKGFSHQLRGVITRGFVLTLAIYACYGLCFQGVIGFLPSFLTDVGGLVLGGIFASTVTLAMGAPGQLVGGYLTDRRGTIWFLTLSFMLLGIVLVLMGFVPGWIAIPVAFAGGFLLFSSQPGTGSLLAEHSSREVRGMAYGLAFMANFGVGAMGTSLAGYIADATGDLRSVFPSMAAFMLAAIVILLVLRLLRAGETSIPNGDR
jgi:MFS family permease